MKDLSAPAEEGFIRVLNPRGTPPPIILVPMAPRLDTLDGKTIYIVDVNFPLTEAFYEALQKLLAEKYPGTNWVLRKKAGTTFDDDPELWSEIREQGNGAIVGPGHMDTLGPAVVGWCLALEKLGVPAAPVIGADFPEIPRKVAYNKGMPDMRITFLPHFVARLPASVCRESLEGTDPVSGRPVLEEIVEALIKPPTAEERKTGTIKRPVPRMVGPDTPESLQRLFRESQMTDFLPIVLPTEERVAEMLRGTSHRADEVVGEMSPSGPHEAWEYTVEQVAVNAVMAGARPEHFPVILAIASTGATSLHTSLTSQARMVVVDGPVRKEIKMNCGIGALGPFNEANAVIGRTWTLISKNLGNGGVPGVTYLGTLGNNYNYNNLCFAEKEEALPPGWQPLHVQKGYQPEESVVTIFGGLALMSFGAHKPDPRHELLRRQLLSFEAWGTGAFFAGIDIGFQATILLSPLVAKELVKEGFGTKEKLSQWLKENTFMTMWNYWIVRPDDLKAAESGVEPFASLLKLPPEAKSPQPLLKPGVPVEIIVVGEETDQPWQAGEFHCVATASVDKWR